MRITSIKGLTQEQERIYDGLLQIGELLAAFYIDAVLIAREQCFLQTKVNLIAHCAREIDGGLREIFVPDREKLTVEATLPGKNKGHYASILVALGNNNTAIADEWLDVAKRFHGLAHRHQPWLKPKNVSEVFELWARYEKILFILTGSFYAIKDRIDQLTNLAVPTPEIIEVLKNLNQGRQNEFQFFKNLNKPDWLKPLFEAGAFDLAKQEPVYDHLGRQVLIDWLPLRYLANIAEAATIRKEKIIVDIIDGLKKQVIAREFFVDDYSVYMIYKTLGGLRNYIFNQSDVEFLNAYYDYAPRGQFPLHESYLLETLVKKYVTGGQKDGLMTLLTYCFGFRKKEEKVDFFKEIGIYTHNSIFPNFSSITHHYTIDDFLSRIIEITGTDLLFALSDTVEELAEVRSYELNSIPSVEVSQQTEMYMHDWILNLVEFIRNGAESLSKEELISFVKHLLSKETDILQRIAIHLIRFSYEDTSDLFWDWIGANRLKGYFNIHELYLLIQIISGKLNIEEFKKLVDWIEQMLYESEHYKQEELVRFKAHRIRCYFSAFQPEEQPQADLLKERSAHYLQIDSWPLEHPEYDTYSTSSMGYDIPIQAVELEAMSVNEQVAYIKALPKKDDFDTTPQGLGLLLNNAIIGAPGKYESALPELLTLGDLYLQQVISSFGWVVKNGTLSDWKTLITKIDERLLRGENPQAGLNDYEQTLTALAELLVQLYEHGDKFDYSLDDLDYLIGLCERLLLIDFPNQLSESSYRDHLSDRLNSLWGKAFDALVGFNRFWSNHAENKGGVKLNKTISAYIEKYISSPETTPPSFFINIGWHFPYLLAIGPEWCAKHAGQLFPIEHGYQFGLVIDNVLSPYQEVHKNVLLYFGDNNLNAYLVNRKYSDEASFNRVCRYALTELNYIDNQSIDRQGSLINLIVEKGDPEQYKALITVALQNKHANEMAMMTLWSNLQDRILKAEKEYEVVIANVGSLALISGVSTQTLDLLDKAIPYLKNGSVPYQLTALLSRRFEISPVRIAETILAIWDQTKLRVMVTEELSDFIEKLYAQGFKASADELCIYVGGLGNYELKPIFDKYQVKNLPSLNGDGL
ncbi:hypothetical protein [Mucilaginibacter sp. SJ]|uniref:hypothetical protein n=1 Tax=Mucilaginibacter sp. SJ TaxID=3029053 RepID=UPI0023A9B6FC|nr:hypothetical protein [Mucilaginibacter sp. SJ]WEA01701.1 hypothetical protein MusilaSJ_02045 [Mucilaginibacter sp. SJ]